MSLPQDIETSTHDSANSGNKVVMEHRRGEKGASILHHANNSSSSDNNGLSNNNNRNHLTVFAKHKVVKGKEHKFETWVREITKLQEQQYKGYRGAEVVRPTCCDSNEYVSIFRYDNYEHLQLWMDSPDRLALLKQTCDFEEGPVEISYHSLEYWFVSNKNDHDDDKNEQDPNSNDPRPHTTSKPPSKPKMIIVTFLLIWLQAHFIGPWIARIPNIPPLAIEATSIFLTVFLTTYLSMPITVQYLLHWWLFPDPNNKQWYIFSPQKKDENNNGIVVDLNNNKDENNNTTTSNSSSIIEGGKREFDKRESNVSTTTQSQSHRTTTISIEGSEEQQKPINTAVVGEPKEQV